MAIHLCIDCEGALRHPKDFKGVITVDGRTLMTVPEIKAFFREQLELGHKVIPCGDCDNFDWETGWVSVEERLPEYNPGTGAKSYWVAKKDNAGNWQMKIAQYCDYGYAMTMDAETEVTWRDWDFTKIANVTHWMPLPAPPDRRPPEGEENDV